MLPFRGWISIIEWPLIYRRGLFEEVGLMGRWFVGGGRGGGLIGRCSTGEVGAEVDFDVSCSFLGARLNCLGVSCFCGYKILWIFYQNGQ